LRYFELTHKCRNYKHFRVRRGGRVAEGGGLLNLPPGPSETNQPLHF
jgi:hypothetical protein